MDEGFESVAVCGVYEIVCVPTQERYVGSSKDIGYRWREHRMLLRAGKHPNQLLRAAWKANGAHAFAFRVIQRHDSIQDARAHENAIIEETCPALNIAATPWGRKEARERAEAGRESVARARVLSDTTRDVSLEEMGILTCPCCSLPLVPIHTPKGPRVREATKFDVMLGLVNLPSQHARRRRPIPDVEPD